MIPTSLLELPEPSRTPFKRHKLRFHSPIVFDLENVWLASLIPLKDPNATNSQIPGPKTCKITAEASSVITDCYITQEHAHSNGPLVVRWTCTAGGEKNSPQLTGLMKNIR